MFSIDEVVHPSTLAEAHAILLESKENMVLGGCTFLRLGKRRIKKALDLTALNLGGIVEKEGVLHIGAMTSFRELETDPTLRKHFDGIIPKAVSSIIGVQFRHSVTVGASVFSKYGFSNLLTALSVLNTEVELYEGGRMPLTDFLQQPLKRDILTSISVKLDDRRACYLDLRNAASDFAILNAAVSKKGSQWKIAVGARPQKAELAVKAAEILRNKESLLSQKEISGDVIVLAGETAAKELSFGSNAKGSKEYREAICAVLVSRGIKEVLQWRSN